MIPRYRVWDKQTERMHIVSGIDFNDGLVSSVNIWHEGWPWVLEPDEIALMQSTGLKDKNGVDIFDGDVVQAEQYLTTTIPVRINGIVKYSNKYTMFYLDNGSERHDLYMQSLGGSIYNFEIIGNIYENPELLKEEQR